MKRYRDYVKRTAAGNESRQSCERTNDYFKFWDLQTSKQKDWTCPEYYQTRLNKQKETEEGTKRETSLNFRRKKLSNLLFEENVAFNGELTKMFEWGEMEDEKLKKNYENLVAKKKEERKFEVEQMSRPNTAKIQVDSEKEMAEESESFFLKELRQAIDVEDEERKKIREQQRLACVSLEDAHKKLRENETLISALMSQEAIISKMEQELFSIDQERLKKEKQRILAEPLPNSYGRQVVFHLRKKASQVLFELDEDRALLERIQKASEQASLMDDVQKDLYLRVGSLLHKMTDQSAREKRVANHNANIFHEEAQNEMKACEQRWLKEKADRKLQLSKVLEEWQTHTREKKGAVTQERQNLEIECKAMMEFTKMQRRAGQTVSDLKDSPVNEIGEQGEGVSDEKA